MAKKVKKPVKKVERDLFGQPVSLISDRWGRPKHRKTKENQSLVALLKIGGHSQADIAQQLNCDEKTLRKYYSRELESGSLKVKTEMIQILYQKARGGNIAAVGKLLKLAESSQLLTIPNSKPSRISKDAAIGKKEQLVQAANDPSGGWADALAESKTVQ